MSNVDTILTQLSLLHNKVKTPSKKKLADREWQPLYKQVCAAYRQATPEQRVDLQIAFESRDALMALFVKYLSLSAQAALKALQKGKDNMAVEALQEALTADVIIDGRTNLDDLQRIHKQIESAADQLHFNMEAFLRKLETPIRIYIDSAYQLHKQGDRTQAIRVLGRALQLDHSLQKSESIGDFAATLTGESPRTAIMTLEDTYQRNVFIEEYESSRRRTIESAQVRAVRESSSSGRKFSLSTILLVIFILAVLAGASYWLYLQIT